ncbi:hypothetical protein LOTGIDRAFT_152681 [Lottia gigantea]|uniref:Sulfotransferase domain-containing protein n=1 Tax=Lottia gigantea TaxID=225164 RepID=V4AKG0_LOTGI|nr:hypothetical protein LOTGIDRAFT_152681 [Lottia gigantea]ESO97592.1 hypothetical protein LOTGIDRAFT_152681 [Lottia gigantea]
MSLVEIKDAGGKTIKYIEHHGFNFVTRNVESVKNYENFKLRESDTLICAYCKSGTHWIWEICRMLLAGTTDLKIIDKETQMIEISDHKDLENQPSPRLVNTHASYDLLPNDFWRYKNKIVYLRRNPKDVAVSFYNHIRNVKTVFDYDGEWKDYLKLFIDGKVINGSWFKYVLQWERVIENSTDVEILDVTFEDFKRNPLQEIHRLCKFFDLSLTDEFIREVKDHCEFKKLKGRKGHLVTTPDGQSSLYRKGEVGDWKNWFTVAQNELFDSIYKKRMVGSKLEFRYE